MNVVFAQTWRFWSISRYVVVAAFVYFLWQDQRALSFAVATFAVLQMVFGALSAIVKSAFELVVSAVQANPAMRRKKMYEPRPMLEMAAVLYAIDRIRRRGR